MAASSATGISEVPALTIRIVPLPPGLMGYLAWVNTYMRGMQQLGLDGMGAEGLDQELAERLARLPPVGETQ